MEMKKESRIEAVSEWTAVDNGMTKEVSDIDVKDVTNPIGVNDNAGNANTEWVNFLGMIKEKEKELGIMDNNEGQDGQDLNMNDNDNNNNINDNEYSKYRAGESE